MVEHTKVGTVVGKVEGEGEAVRPCSSAHLVKYPGVPRTRWCQKDYRCLLHSRDPRLLDQLGGCIQRPCQDRHCLGRTFQRCCFWLLCLSSF